MKRHLIKLNFSFATILTLLAWSLTATAQDGTQPASTSRETTTNAILVNTPATGPAPVYTNFMGVSLGMITDEAREKLGKPKDKSEQQDFFVFSDSLTAQVFYDQGKVVAISVDYVGSESKAPAAEEIIGQAVSPRPDGSLYALMRYPEAGFWVAYSKTSGDNPITTVTLRKM